MKRSLVGMLAALALALGLRAIPASAEDGIEFASHAELMSVLEEQNNRIAELEAGIVTGGEGGCSSCGGGGCSSCNTCGGCGTCNDCCHSTGLYAKGELTFLRYHKADGVRSQPSVFTPVQRDIEFDFELSPRITLGYVFEDGLGLRTRWWDYNHENSVNNTVLLANVANTLEVDTYTWDVELFDTFRINRNWTLELSGGFRYNEFDENYNTLVTVLGVPTFDSSYESDFAGWGALLGAQVTREIGNGLSVFFMTRGSILMDDETVRAQVALFNREETQIDDVKGVWEMQLGVQHSQCIGEGASVFVSAAAEYQMWMNYANQWDFDVLAVTGPEEHETDVGFGGFTFAIGLTR